MRIRLVNFASSSLNIEIQVYVATTDVDEFYAVREDLLLRMMDVVAASGETMTFWYFSLTFATASVIGEEYGPMTASTLSSVISFS